MSEGTSGPTSEAPAELTIQCAGCGRGIELCSFCDRTECGSAICYRCLLLDLTRVVPELHEQGG